MQPRRSRFHTAAAGLCVVPCALQNVQNAVQKTVAPSGEQARRRQGGFMAFEGIEAFREFIVFAKHLSITKASEELHVAPSTLSRHLGALEREIGMPLISHQGSNLALTPVGSLVLKKASTIVGEYQNLLEQVARYKEDAGRVVRVAYALDDRTIIDAVSLAKLHLKKTYGGFNVQPFHVRGKSTREALLDGEVDLIIDYNLDEKGLKDERLVTIALMEDSIVLALPAGTLPDQGTVHVNQVCRRYIPHPSASVDNYFDRVIGLFANCEQQPAIRFIDASTMDEFFMHALDADEMWLFSRRQFFNYASSIPLSYRASCEIHELAGCDTSYRRYAVYRADNPNRLVPLFAQELAATDPAQE